MTELAGQARPLLRRQLDALADWLAEPNWTLAEAAALLVGVLPAGRDSRADFGPWLPGNEPWEQREVWEWKVKGDIDRMVARLATVDRLGLMPSGTLLTLAHKQGAIPPWLAYALDDVDCAALLPDDLREQEEKRRQASEGIAVRNMKTRERHGQFRAAMVAHARAVIADLKIDGRLPDNLMRDGEPWKAEIIRRIQVTAPRDFSDRTLYDWMADGTLKL